MKLEYGKRGFREMKLGAKRRVFPRRVVVGYLPPLITLDEIQRNPGLYAGRTVRLLLPACDDWRPMAVQANAPAARPHLRWTGTGQPFLEGRIMRKTGVLVLNLQPE